MLRWVILNSRWRFVTEISGSPAFALGIARTYGAHVMIGYAGDRPVEIVRVDRSDERA